jgi:hypothetical protein
MDMDIWKGRKGERKNGTVGGNQYDNKNSERFSIFVPTPQPTTLLKSTVE